MSDKKKLIQPRTLKGFRDFPPALAMPREQMIDKARALGLEYVYLGFWIADCSKMSYKSKFQPMETLSPEGWHIQGEQ